jgi:uncharacterized membrane protein (DUF2068 family)
MLHYRAVVERSQFPERDGFADAWGLWRGRAWAQWFAIFSGLLYLPWEARALWVKPDVARAALLLGNVLLVAHMARVRLAACGR